MCVCKATPTFSHVLFSSARDPVHLSVGGLAVFAAPFLGAWWLFVLGVVAYAALVGWRAASPSYWQRVLRSDIAEQHRLPDTLTLGDPLLRTIVTELRAARGSVLHALEETPRPLRAHVRFAETTLDELECLGARLVRRAESLGHYLAAVRRDSIEDELRRMGDLARRSSDAEARRSYELARLARKEQLTALDEVQAAQDRIVARLQRVIACLEGLPVRIVRLRVLEAGVREDVGAELDEELERLSGELRETEESVGALQGDGAVELLLT